MSGVSYFGKTGIATWNIPVVSHGDVNNTPVWGMLRSFGCVQTFLEIHLGAMCPVIKRNTVSSWIRSSERKHCSIVHIAVASLAHLSALHFHTPGFVLT